MNCGCGAELPTSPPTKRAGRPRLYCTECQKERARAAARARYVHKPVNPQIERKAAARADRMGRLYRTGWTLEQIGQEYGVTRERVRQILRARTAVTSKDGGKAFQARVNRARRERERDRRCRAKWGCAWRAYKAIGLDAKRAYHQQRMNAAARGILWEFTLWSWWQVWRSSGKWGQRGRKRGCYVMARVGDVGSYAPDNVRVVTCTENMNEWRARVGYKLAGEQVAA
jgi:hypothetical protein